jgi:hypothetical protein
VWLKISDAEFQKYSDPQREDLVAKFAVISYDSASGQPAGGSKDAWRCRGKLGDGGSGVPPFGRVRALRRRWNTQQRRSAPVPGRSNMKPLTRLGKPVRVRTMRACCARGRAHSAVPYPAGLAVSVCFRRTDRHDDAKMKQRDSQIQRLDAMAPARQEDPIHSIRK